LCTLGDGNEWLVPFARRWLGSNNGQLRPVSALPSAAVYSENGQWTVGTVVAKYSRLNDLAGEFWDRYFASDEPDDKQVPTIWQNEREACVTALATNYYLGPWECSLLGLFTPDAVAQILGALIDRPTLNEWVSKQKKKT
jgi:hypothetical protein